MKHVKDSSHNTPEWILNLSLKNLQSFVPYSRSMTNFHLLFDNFPLKSIVDFRRGNITMPQAGTLVAKDDAVVQEKISRLVNNIGLRRAITSFGGGGMAGILTDVITYSLRFRIGTQLAWFPVADFSSIRWEKSSEDLYFCHCDLGYFTALIGDPFTQCADEYKGAYLLDGLSDFRIKPYSEAHKFVQKHSDNNYYGTTYDEDTGFEIVKEPRREILSAHAQWVVRRLVGNKFNVQLKTMHIESNHMGLLYREQKPDDADFFLLPESDFKPVIFSSADNLFTLKRQGVEIFPVEQSFEMILRPK